MKRVAALALSLGLSLTGCAAQPSAAPSAASTSENSAVETSASDSSPRSYSDFIGKTVAEAIEIVNERGDMEDISYNWQVPESFMHLDVEKYTPYEDKFIVDSYELKGTTIEITASIPEDVQQVMLAEVPELDPDSVLNNAYSIPDLRGMSAYEAQEIVIEKGLDFDYDSDFEDSLGSSSYLGYLEFYEEWITDFKVESFEVDEENESVSVWTVAPQRLVENHERIIATEEGEDGPGIWRYECWLPGEDIDIPDFFIDFKHVWESEDFDNYEGCIVSFFGPHETFEGVKREALEIIESTPEQEVDTRPNEYETALAYCAVPRIPFEEDPADLSNVPEEHLKAAALLCPTAPFIEKLQTKG